MQDSRLYSFIPAPRSRHARLRQSQRNVSDEQLAYVQLYGTPICRTGVTVVALRDRDIPVEDRREDRWAKLAGTRVVISNNGWVITVYRNRDTLRDITRKPKYRRHRQRGNALAERQYEADSATARSWAKSSRRR